MAVIHICAENRAEAVSSGKNGQRAERQERPDKLKPNSYSTQDTLSSDAIALCLCVEVFTQSGRAVIATTCTMSDLPKNKLILHTGLTPHARRSLFMFRWEKGMRDRIKEMKGREEDDVI